MTFQAAGPDDDLHTAYMKAQVDCRCERGKELLTGAKALMRSKPSRQNRRRAERAAREALVFYAGALDWAEETAQEAETHAQLDAAGHWVRHTFGCHLHREGKSYSQRCPVALGHNRIGMSIGGAAKRVCSLCGQDLSECEHRRGIAYLVPGGASNLGWCRVCLKKDGCDHRADEEYRVSVVSIITEMELLEVSIVGRPAHPDARFKSISIDVNELRDHLGEIFTPGVPVSCDRCLLPCDGLTRHDSLHM